MNLNKDSQYGILFCLYLVRAGRSTTKLAAQNLGLSPTFIAQIARKLKLSNIVKASKGPKGGYELREDVTIYEVLRAFTDVRFLTNKEQVQYISAPPEFRALLNLSQNMFYGLRPALNRRVKDVMYELVDNEVIHLDELDTTGVGN